MNSKFILNELLIAYKRLSEINKTIDNEDTQARIEVVLTFNITSSIFEAIGTRYEEDVNILESQLQNYIKTHDNVSADEFLSEIDFYIRRQKR